MLGGMLTMDPSGNAQVGNVCVESLISLSNWSRYTLHILSGQNFTYNFVGFTF